MTKRLRASGRARGEQGNRLTEPLRGMIQHAFSGQSTGIPDWLSNLADGEDIGPYPPESAAWAVHGGMPPIVAGIRALLMQALHPGALAGVHDFSRYREDPLGRLAGTIRWIFTVTYGDTATGIEATRWVRRLHERVRGTYLDEDGTEHPYSANDPELARWVHIAFTDSFLQAQLLWGDPIPGGADAYVAEWAYAGELMGVVDPPRTAAELAAQLAAYDDSGILRSGERVDEVVSFLRRPPIRRVMLPGYRVLFGGAVSSIEPRYRALLKLDAPRLGPVPLPARASTGLTLGAIARIIGPRTTAERYALMRVDRLRGGAPTT